MVNEHSLLFETQPPIPFTVADGVGIEQGAMLTLSDPFTVASTGANADAICGGIAAEEKIASNGEITIGTYRGGIFRATASAAIAIGNTLAMTGSGNRLKPSVAADVGGKTVGIALEVASGNGSTFLYELKPTAVDLA